MTQQIKPIRVIGSTAGGSSDLLEIRLNRTEHAEETLAATFNGTNTSLIPWVLEPSSMIDLHLSNPWLAAITNILADACSVARIELEPFEYDADGNELKNPDQDEYARVIAWLHRSVIAQDGELELNLSGFLRTAALHWDATGNIFVEVVRNLLGTMPMRLAFLLPQFCWYEKTSDHGLRLFQRDIFRGEYAFKPFGTRVKSNMPREFMHERLPNMVSSVYGLPAWIAARDSISLDNAHRNYLKGFFKNHGTPRWMITITQDAAWVGQIPDSTALEQLHVHVSSYLNANRGEMAGRNLVLQYPGGITVNAQALDIKIDDPTFGATAKNARDEIMAVRHMSLIDLGLPEGGYRSTADTQSDNFRDHVLMPHSAPAIRILNRIISSEAPHGLGCKTWQVVAKFEKADEALKKMETLIKATGGAPILTPNEGRQELGYEAVTGGDVLFIASSLVPMGEEGMLEGQAEAE
jgi:phage portal protein BeeE